MKPLCHQIASLEDVTTFQTAFRANGYFEASLPLVNPNATWPEPGDMLAIHVQNTNLTMMAFVRRVSPGTRHPGESFSRILVMAGYRPRERARLPGA